MSDDTTDTQDENANEAVDDTTSEMTIEQQLEHWKSVAAAARRAEDKAKGKSADPAKSVPYLSKQLAQTQKELEELRKAGMSQAEKDLQAKFDEGRTAATDEAALKFGSRIVSAEARGLLTGRGLETERIAAIVDALAPGKYLKDDGDVDTEALTTFIDAVAPKPSGNSANAWGATDFGQGRRESVANTPGSRGRAEAERRFGKKSA